MKITAVGDMIIQRRIPENFKGYEELAPFIKRGNARFFNLETTLNEEGECCASQFSGGTYIRTSPKILEDIKKFGFNITSFNNNHALDYSYGGFKRTLEEVEKSGLVHAGAGNNLAQASAPKFLETENGRVALIAVNTTFSPPAIAGEQTRRVPGRPGINGLRLKEHIEVNEEEFEFIQKLADATGINVSKNITVGLMEDRKMFETVIPYWETESGKLKRLELLPVMCSMDGNKSEIGLPMKAEDVSFMERLAEISKPFGVTLHKENDIFVCEWK